jgi:hypothetical protein
MCANSKRNRIISLHNSKRNIALALPHHQRFSFISTCKTKIKFKHIEDTVISPESDESDSGGNLDIVVNEVRSFGAN